MKIKINKLVVDVDKNRSVKPQNKVLLYINTHYNILNLFYLFIPGSQSGCSGSTYSKGRLELGIVV